MKNSSKVLMIIIAIFLISHQISFAQVDTAKYTILELNIDAGIFFPRNEDFQNLYNLKSTINWSVGTRIGKSTKLFNTWIKYSHYQSERDSINKDSYSNKDKMKRNQLSLGLVTAVKISSNDFIQFKSGVSYNFISESLSNFYSEPIGFLFSIGYRKSFHSCSYYADFGYDYARVNKGQYFGEWSGFILCTGICFNLLSDK